METRNQIKRPCRGSLYYISGFGVKRFVRRNGDRPLTFNSSLGYAITSLESIKTAIQNEKDLRTQFNELMKTVPGDVVKFMKEHGDMFSIDRAIR